MGLTRAERLSSHVLKRAASRGASGWFTAFKLWRGRFASESELCTSRGEQLPPRPTALEWCTSASEAVHTSLGCTLERLRPLRPRAASRAGYAACICFCETAAAAFGAALSSCSDVARVQASFTGER